MAIWKKSYAYLVRHVTSPVKKIRIFLKHRFNWLDIPLIITYRGYGNDKMMFIKGCVIEDKGLGKPEHDNSVWENAKAMLKRYTSDEIPGIKVSLKVNGYNKILTTDENGIFETIFEHTNNISGKITYNAEIVTNAVEEANKKYTTGEVLIPPDEAAYGIISDIDDTILISHSTKLLRKLQLMLLRNAYTRKPFPGVAEFYRCLGKGFNEKSNNPFFYVSSSEWNLYDLLDDFCSFNNFPKGVFLLREMVPGLFKLWKSGRGNHDHKYQKIKTIFNTYPEMSFILVGDNGQKDPEIYSRIAEEFPYRIKAIYIRSVINKNKAEIKNIISKLSNNNIEIILVKNTFEAAIHAYRNNLIPESALAGISKEVYKDINKPGELQQMLKF